MQPFSKFWPHPKEAGIVHVPPKAKGNKASSTLRPVKRGESSVNLSSKGRGCLNGHF